MTKHSQSQINIPFKKIIYDQMGVRNFSLHFNTQFYDPHDGGESDPPLTPHVRKNISSNRDFHSILNLLKKQKCKNN